MNTTTSFIRMFVITASLIGAASQSGAWSTNPSVVEPLSFDRPHSIERDGKGEYLVGYIKKGSVGYFGEEIWLKYHNGTSWTDYKVFEASDVELSTGVYLTPNYSLLKIPVFTSVSVAVRHDDASGGAQDTTICVAAAVGRIHDTYNVDRVVFVYEELTLSSTGTLTAGSLETIIKDGTVAGNDNPNALQWFDTASCHPQPSPANNRYYANGTHHDGFTDYSGVIRATYSGDTLWFGCSVRGYVDHDYAAEPGDPENGVGYRYEEHSALYLIKEDGSDWTFVGPSSDDFFFETCEIVNPDDPWLGPNEEFQLTADNTAGSTDDDTWVLGYHKRNYINMANESYRVAQDDGSGGVTDHLIPCASASPFVAVCDGEPFVIYDSWESDWRTSPDPTPLCSEDYLAIESLSYITPLDNAPTGIGVTCSQDPGYIAGSGANTIYTGKVVYAGVSYDGEDLHVVTRPWPANDRQPCARYKMSSLVPNTTPSTSIEDGPVGLDNSVRDYFGDRVAVRATATKKAVILAEEGEEDRGDFDYYYRIKTE